MIALLFSLGELLLALAALITLWRLVKGPSVFDRILCVESLLLMLVGYLLLESAVQPARPYLDAALGLALFSFIGTAFLATFLGRRELDD